MKKSLFALPIIAILITLFALFFGQEDPFKILLIGNSYTFNNDLPKLVKEMIKENKRGVEIKALTPGGAKLEDHLNSSFTVDTIRNGNWDIVILQGHSLEPLRNPTGFSKAATDLIQIIKESDADVYLFETWSRAEGHSIYSEAWSGHNPDSMQSKLSMKYQELAKNTDASVIPIGTIWRQLLNESQDMELHSTDGSHPTQIGTYLTACIIYYYIIKEDPGKLSYVSPAIEESEAKLLRQYAALLAD